MKTTIWKSRSDALLRIWERGSPISDSHLLLTWRGCGFAWCNPEQEQLQGELETEVCSSGACWVAPQQCFVGAGGPVSDEKCWESGMVAQWLNPWFRVCLCYVSIVSPDKVRWMQRFSRDLLSVLYIWVALINVNGSCMCSKSEDSPVMPWEGRLISKWCVIICANGVICDVFVRSLLLGELPR